MKKEEDYWNGYLIGFIAGEGCFHINIFDQRKSQWQIKVKNKIRFEIKPEFRISLTASDLESLEFIKTRFGFGDIFEMKKDEESRSCECKQILIAGLKRCKEIIKLIDKYVLIGKKKDDYLLWKEAIKLIENKEHLNKEGILKIAKIRDAMNHIGKAGKRKRYRDYNWFKENLK